MVYETAGKGEFAMDAFGGFMMLEKKKELVIPILSQYDFSSALSAVFAITSWRNNRGALESCLALNSALAQNKVWGDKRIVCSDDLSVFFQHLSSALHITSMDDPVLPDFGEIKLNFHSRYYSVSTIIFQHPKCGKNEHRM